MKDDVYIVLNKPSGYVCSTVSDRSSVVFDLIDKSLLEECRSKKKNLHTVGRLDKETEGLLLLTTDGMFSHNLTVPEHSIRKVYSVILRDSVTEEGQELYRKAFSDGVMLPADKKFPEQQARPALIEWKEPDCAEITVTEGKFHQVRRMFMAMGNEVVRLKRVCIGSLSLDDSLEPGKYRSLTVEEIKSLEC